MIFLYILLNIIFPVFFIIFSGFLLDKIFHLDIQTLSKLNFYIFVPALLFIKILEADVLFEDILLVGGFSLIHVFILFIISWFVFSSRIFIKNRSIFTMGSIFYNAGNYGIPLTLLLFGNDYIGIVAVILLVQNFLHFSVGIVLVQGKKNRISVVIRNFFKIPSIYAILSALLIKTLQIEISQLEFLFSPLSLISDGLISVALITLGVQLARVKFSKNVLPVLFLSALRLIISPLIAFILSLWIQFEKSVEQILIIMAGLPVAVNVYILAVEYKNNDELASQSVFWSTLLSSITLSVLILITGSYQG